MWVKPGMVLAAWMTTIDLRTFGIRCQYRSKQTPITKEIQQLRSAEADLFRQQGDGDQKKQAADRIIPTTQHILESYPLLTPAEKNRLWKLVMKKATVYRSPEDNLTVNIYPNLPK